MHKSINLFGFLKDYKTRAGSLIESPALFVYDEVHWKRLQFLTIV
jgi:hypothetical protein